MTREVVVLEECTDLLAAAGQMASWACRRVPVVDHRGAVRGVVTVDDVALVLSELVDNLADRAYRGSTRAKRYVRRSAPLTAVIVTRSSRDA
jgi:Mg/Co/Ni transporter MgtE